MCIGLKAGCGYDCFTSSTIRDAVAELRRRDAKIALCTVPIGLPDGREKRRCDILAREFLGCRRNSVFPIPCRRAVEAYREADGGKNEKKQAGRDVSYAVTKKVLPNQSWDLAPHIIELDEFLFEDPDARGLFRETHAEICFRGLNGNELLTSKKQREGVQKRRELLQEYFPQAEHVYENARSCPGVVANSEISMTNSNILDVLAAALTAKLGADGDTPYRSLGSETKDSRGLPMQMLYVDPREKIRARSKQ
ncbi:MAG: DUF429 domain-containing protein [Gammaproteobacteria bacterium]|nr:DUF429 domain-containing protein [Gammaproteobacteria bacterium]